jgi:hypothetical protein
LLQRILREFKEGRELMEIEVRQLIQLLKFYDYESMWLHVRFLLAFCRLHGIDTMEIEEFIEKAESPWKLRLHQYKELN